MIKARWDALDPRKKRYILIGGVAAAVFGAISMMSEPDTKTNRNSRQDVIKHVLTDRDTRTVGLEALSADLKSLRQENHNLKRTIDRLEKDVKDRMPATAPDSSFRNEIDEVKGELERLRALNREALERGQNGATASANTPGTSVVTDSNQAADGSTFSLDSAPVARAIDPSNPGAIFENSSWPSPSRTNAPVVTEASTSAQPAAPSSAGGIKRHVETVPETKDDDSANKQDEMLFLPAGSIITGTFLNGIDAPTGQGARRDPFPSTLRIQKEAILPNRFRADIRECFLIVSGYGDLSSERAYLRGETISCVREDGGVIESNLDSYAVGEDGKAGVRGRLVSKQGQIIAKSLMAGFLSGLSKAFDVKPVPVLDTRNSGKTSYSKNEPNADWLQSSAVSGAGNALDRIADFYLEMAEGMFPVIEIDAGRQIDVIVSRGTNLQTRSKAPTNPTRGTSNRNQR